MDVIDWRSSSARPGVSIGDIYISLILAGIRIFILNTLLDYAVTRLRVIRYIYIADRLISVVIYFIYAPLLADGFNSEGFIYNFKAIKFKGSRRRNLYKISKGFNRVILRFVELLMAN